MYKKLEEFVRENRDAFDSDKPSDEVWENIQYGLDLDKKQGWFTKNKIIRLVSIVAATVLVISGIWYFTRTKPDETITAKANLHDKASPVKDSSELQQSNIDSPIVKPEKNEDNENANADEFKEELFYYTRLTAIKYNQLKRIEKDEPVLYKNFSREIKKLDSTYHDLQHLLQTNPKKELVLTAMINNLKMQAELLSKQLDIIHTIKQSKKSKYENDYKTL